MCKTTVSCSNKPTNKRTHKNIYFLHTPISIENSVLHGRVSISVYVCLCELHLYACEYPLMCIKYVKFNLALFRLRHNRT